MQQSRGIKAGYPRIRRSFGKLADYIQLCRPFTLLAPIIAGLFGSVIRLGGFTEAFENLHTVVYIAITLALCQAAGQAVNQACDAELDKLVKPYRPIPRGVVSVEEAMGVGLLLGLAAVLRAATINPGFASVTILILFFAIFYNLEPIRAKKYLGLNLAWMSVSRGFLPFIAVWTAYGSVDETCIKLGILATIWCLAFQGSKDIPDIEGDLKFGIRTIANTYGMEGLICLATLFSTVFYTLAYRWGFHILLLTIPLAALGVWGINKPSPVTENTIGWICFYVNLSMIYVLTALTAH